MAVTIVGLITSLIVLVPIRNTRDLTAREKLVRYIFK